LGLAVGFVFDGSSQEIDDEERLFDLSFVPSYLFYLFSGNNLFCTF
jgi:hypothetical protein